MPDCEFRIEGPDELSEGESATYRIVPPIEHPCTARWKVNGQRADGVVGRDVGDIHVTGVSAVSLGVRAVADGAVATIEATVECPGPNPCGPTTQRFLIAPPGTVHLGPDGEPLKDGVDAEEVLRWVVLPITGPLCVLCEILRRIRRAADAPEESWTCWLCDLLPSVFRD